MTTPNTPNAAERPSDRAIAQAVNEAVEGFWERGLNPDLAWLPAILSRAHELDSHHRAESVSAEPVAIVVVSERMGKAFAQAYPTRHASELERGDYHCYLRPQHSAPGAVSDEDVTAAAKAALQADADATDNYCVETMFGIHRAKYMRNFRAALESFTKRSAVGTAQEDGDVVRITEDALIGETMLPAGTPTMDVVAAAQKAAREHVAAPPAQAVSVPEAVRNEGMTFGGCVPHGTYSIASGYQTTRIVDERFAQGWNECREAFVAALSTAPAAAMREGKE